MVAVLLEVGSSTPMYFVADNVNWSYNGHTFVPFPFKINGIQSSSKGELPRIDISISNVTNLITQLLDEDLEGVPVKIYVLREGETTPDLSFDFAINSVSYTAEWLTLSLGEKVNFAQNYPKTKYSQSCPFIFKGWRCKYSGSAAKCNHTAKNCQQLGNLARFGGFQQ